MVKDYKKLIYSIIIDLVGMASYIIPVGGELFDLIWGPISAILVYKLYGNMPIAIFNLFEEILPFTDIVPTATIAWFLESYKIIKRKKR